MSPSPRTVDRGSAIRRAPGVALPAALAVGLAASPWLTVNIVLLIAGAGAGYSLSGSV